MNRYHPWHRQNGICHGSTRELQDDELLAQARDWRQRALRGETDARGFAHELECEARQRFPRNDTPLTLPPVRLLGKGAAASPAPLEALVNAQE
ncbi:hypothetical protein [Ottowia sp.]|uniref:hypothetical protein n=1 Tax=Ottowia sp. TaxID=1898956 RepID=UPI0025FF768F|nr:hypothetical protein [Ottowia sp.]